VKDAAESVAPADVEGRVGVSLVDRWGQSL